jgi:PAS domain S-box-containing protein
MPVFDQEKVDRLKQILKWNPRGITISDLATKLEINRNLVAKYLDILLISGQVEMQVIGAAKVYFLSHRIPISSILEFSSDMVIILDGARTIIQVNEPLLVVIKEKKDAFVGRNIREIDHPFLKAIPITAFSKETDPAQSQVHEFECTVDEEKHYYKFKRLQTAFEDGSQGITLIIEDITAQVTYQRMLELSEAKYRGIVEDQTEFITRFLPDGTLVFVNNAYARYLGKEIEELLGKQHIPDIENHDRTTMHGCIQSLDLENPVKTFECRIHHSCGQVRWNLWTVRALFDENQNPLEYQGVGRDNTEKREAALRINQYIRDTEFLSRKAQEFVELSPDADIFSAIAQGISEIIPDSLITVNSINVQTDTLTVRAVLPNRDRESLKKCIGMDLLGFQFNLSVMPEDQKMHFFSAQHAGKLVHVEENLHTIFFQQISQDVCDMIKKGLDLGESLYTIGLARHGILFGNVSFSPRKGEHVTSSSIIETFVRQASIVLHRRRTDDALKSSEARYRSVIENIQDVFYRSDTAGNLIMASPSWAELLGYDSLDDCIGYNIAEKFYFEPHRRKEFLDAVYRNGSVSDYEVVLKYKDGTPLYVSTNSHLYYDDTGELLGVEGIFRDIRERHAAAEKIQNYITTLKESEEIFSSVAQYAPVPIAIIEPDGTYRYVNQKFIETFGYDLNDFKTGTEWFSLAYPDPLYRKKVIDTWKSDLGAFKSGLERPELFTVRCKNGVDREIIFRPVTLSDKKQCVVYEDLTDQHKAEQVQKLLSLIVETTSDAIIGEKIDGTIISMNPAAEQLYGYSKEEVIGQNISLIIPRERLDESNRIFDRIIKREAINNIETRRVRKDGRVIDVELTISPITDENGRVIGASTIARDISLKNSEKRLRESEEKYRTQVENLNVGIYRSTGDPRGRFVWGNSSLVEILGYPSFETLQQIAVADIFTEPDGRKKLLEDLQRFGFVKNREIYLIRDDGNRICVSITALAKFDPAGKIEFINGIVEDVSHKKEISSQLQKFRYDPVDLVGYLPDPAFVVSEDHQVIAWNTAMEQMTGVSKNEIIGSEGFLHTFPKNNSSLAIMADLINLIDASDEVIEKYDPPLTREGNTLVAHGYFPSLYSDRGSYIWAKASPLIDHDGKRRGVIEVIRDISPVKELNQLLKNPKTGCIPGSDAEISIPDAAYPVFPDHDTIKTPGLLSPNYLSSALKMARDYIAILDRSGKCVWVNDALVSAVNAQSCNDLAGKSIALYIAPEFRKMALDSLGEVKKNGHKTVPFMMLSSSGRVQVEANISAITTEEGDIFGYMAIARHVEGKKSKNHNGDKK